MKVGKTLSIAIISALLAACSSSSGGKSSPSSIGQLPGQYRDIVSKEKTIKLEYSDSGYNGTLTVNGKAGGEYNLSDLPNGTNRLPFSESYQNPQGATTNYSGTMLVYQQPYSLVTGTTYTQGSGAEFKPEYLNALWAGEARGFSTPALALNKLITEDAIFRYKGVALDGKEEGTLNYTMSFGQRKGYGSITGFTRTGSIDLAPAQLRSDWRIEGEARLEKDRGNGFVEYELSFFGPNAEEIAGHVYDNGNGRGDKGILGDNDIIFAGEGKSILNP